MFTKCVYSFNSKIHVIQLLGHCDLRSVPLLRMSDIIVGNCVWDKCLTGLNNEVIILNFD